MPLDPNIILRAGQGQQIDPAQTIGNALAIRNLQTQARVAEEERARVNQLRGSTKFTPAGEIDLAGTLEASQGLLTPSEQASFQHQVVNDRLTRDKAALEKRKLDLEASEKNLQYVGNVLASLGPNPPVQALHAAAKGLIDQGMKIDLSQLPTDQAQVPAFIQQTQASVLGVEKTLQQHRADWEAMVKAYSPDSPLAKSLKSQKVDEMTGGTFLPPGSPSGGVGGGNFLTAGSPRMPLPGSSEVTPDVVAAPMESSASPLYASEQMNAAKGDADKIAEYDANGKIRIRQPVVQAKKDIATAGANQQYIQAYEKKRDTNIADSVVKAQDAAENAYATADQFQLIEDLLQGYGGGPIEGQIAKGLKYLPGFENLTTAQQVAGALRSKLAPQVRVAGSGATSDFEMAMYLDSIPSMMTTPEGRRMMTQIARRVAERAAFAADLKDQLAQEGRYSVKAMRDGMKTQFGDTFLSPEEIEAMKNAGTRKGKVKPAEPRVREVKPTPYTDLK